MSLNETIAHLRILTQTTPLYQHIGKVCKVSGLLVESQGPQCALGDLVSIVSPNDEALIDAEVIGFHDTHVLLMPLGENNNIAYGCRVVLNNRRWTEGQNHRCLRCSHGQAGPASLSTYKTLQLRRSKST